MCGRNLWCFHLILWCTWQHSAVTVPQPSHTWQVSHWLELHAAWWLACRKPVCCCIFSRCTDLMGRLAGTRREGRGVFVCVSVCFQCGNIDGNLFIFFLTQHHWSCLCWNMYYFELWTDIPLEKISVLFDCKSFSFTVLHKLFVIIFEKVHKWVKVHSTCVHQQ